MPSDHETAERGTRGAEKGAGAQGTAPARDHSTPGRCAGVLRVSRSAGKPCSRRGSVLIQGDWYCGTHALLTPEGAMTPERRALLGRMIEAHLTLRQMAIVLEVPLHLLRDYLANLLNEMNQRYGTQVPMPPEE